MLIFLQDVYDSVNLNSQTDVVYLEFKKKLLIELFTMNCCSNYDQLVLLVMYGDGSKHAYLTQRHQCVSINNSVSTKLPVVSGVPQVSILGPLLFFNFHQ